MVDEVGHALEELGPAAVTLWAVVAPNLHVRERRAQLEGLALLPGAETVDDEVTGLGGAAKGVRQLAAVLIDHAKRRIGFWAAHIVVSRAAVPPVALTA